METRDIHLTTRYLEFVKRIKRGVFLGFLFMSVGLQACGGGGSNSSTPTGVGGISTWAFVDGNGANGINQTGAKIPQLTGLGAKLYAIWTESSSGILPEQIRVAVYNNNETAPSWSFVDGNTGNGINKDITKSAYLPQLTGFGTKLYAIWAEYNGSVREIRVAVYNGNDSVPSWSFVDGSGSNGINKNSVQSANNPQLTVFGSNLYAIWAENNSTDQQIRVAVYNGNDSAPSWSFVDGNGTIGINKNSAAFADNPQLTVFGSKLYSIWVETIGQIRVAVYNGNDTAPSWSFVDGSGSIGINKDSTQSAYSPQLTVFGSNLYAIWAENNSTGHQIRVAVYNGNDTAPSWSFIDGNGSIGVNKDSAYSADNPQLTVFGSQLYAIWGEYNSNLNQQIRVAVYNGNDTAPSWSFIDGNGSIGINKDSSQSADNPQLTVFGSKLYSIWAENVISQQIRVAVGH